MIVHRDANLLSVHVSSNQHVKTPANSAANNTYLARFIPSPRLNEATRDNVPFRCAFVLVMTYARHCAELPFPLGRHATPSVGVLKSTATANRSPEARQRPNLSIIRTSYTLALALLPSNEQFLPSAPVQPTYPRLNTPLHSFTTICSSSESLGR